MEGACIHTDFLLTDGPHQLSHQSIEVEIISYEIQISREEACNDKHFNPGSAFTVGMSQRVTITFCLKFE